MPRGAVTRKVAWHSPGGLDGPGALPVQTLSTNAPAGSVPSGKKKSPKPPLWRLAFRLDVVKSGTLGGKNEKNPSALFRSAMLRVTV
jgi:hypothetical protein